MAGLDPAIPVFLVERSQDVDARHKAGHDDLGHERGPLADRLARLQTYRFNCQTTSGHASAFPRRRRPGFAIVAAP